MNRRFLIDAAERVAWTAVEAAAAALLAAGAFDAKAGKAATVAGLTAAVAVVKVIAAKWVGDHNTAAIGGPAPKVVEVHHYEGRAADAPRVDTATLPSTLEPTPEPIRTYNTKPAKKAAKPATKAAKKKAR